MSTFLAFSLHLISKGIWSYYIYYAKFQLFKGPNHEHAILMDSFLKSLGLTEHVRIHLVIQLVIQLVTQLVMYLDFDLLYRFTSFYFHNWHHLFLRLILISASTLLVTMSDLLLIFSRDYLCLWAFGHHKDCKHHLQLVDIYPLDLRPMKIWCQNCVLRRDGPFALQAN